MTTYLRFLSRALLVDHPCSLIGSIEDVVSDARKAVAFGVDEINLLAYRYNGDVDHLMDSVKTAVDLPLIIARSIDNFERTERVMRLGAWGFTIGSVIFEGKLSQNISLADQIKAVMAEIEKKEEK